MTIAGIFAPQFADLGNFLPLLFVIYVIYAIVSSVAKAARQAAQAQRAAASSPPAPDQPLVTAADVRLALQRRLAAAAARSQAVQAAAQSAPRAVTGPAVAVGPAVATAPAMTDLGSAADMLPMPALPDVPLGAATRGVDLSALLANLPLAAQAVVASAVIGPCAAHRGGGHDPEDW